MSHNTAKFSWDSQQSESSIQKSVDFILLKQVRNVYEEIEIPAVLMVMCARQSCNLYPPRSSWRDEREWQSCLTDQHSFDQSKEQNPF